MNAEELKAALYRTVGTGLRAKGQYLTDPESYRVKDLLLIARDNGISVEPRHSAETLRAGLEHTVASGLRASGALKALYPSLRDEDLWETANWYVRGMSVRELLDLVDRWGLEVAVYVGSKYGF